jgi:hypothetical protein
MDVLVKIALVLKQHIYRPKTSISELDSVEHVRIIISQICFNKTILTDLQGGKIHKIHNPFRQGIYYKATSVFRLLVDLLECLIVGVFTTIVLSLSVMGEFYPGVANQVKRCLESTRHKTNVYI